MAIGQNRVAEPQEDASEIFDQAHLLHYTMDLPELAAEVAGLFLSQLPVTIEHIEMAASQAEWKLATHSLKGAAGSVGAHRLQRLALELEQMGFDADTELRRLRLQLLKAAAQEFRARVKQIYP